MNILNFGSLNYDDVYAVNHIVTPGETISSTNFMRNPGGKGLNQSVALARAGAHVFHAGNIGPDGNILLQLCAENDIDVHHVRIVEGRSGNAIIQVAENGQNSIILFPGANRMNDYAFVDAVLSEYSQGDLVLLQNEINMIDYIIDRAYERGMAVALNPSPFDRRILECSLEKVTFFLLNGIEGAQLTGRTDPERILDEMLSRWPSARVVLTLGEHGAIYRDAKQTYTHSAYKVKVEDTTAAGDTFTGYFLAAVTEGASVENGLMLASIASSIAVSQKGAVCSIPTRKQISATWPKPF